MNTRLPWRYRLYQRLPLWAKRVWGYDWVEDDRLTRRQIMAIFQTLEPAVVVGPTRSPWVLRKPDATIATGTSYTYDYRPHRPVVLLVPEAGAEE